MDNYRNYYEEVGRRVREARKQHRPPLTQEALAKMVSLTRTSITNLEKGRQKILLHTLADLAAVLKVDPASLLPQPNGGAERRLSDVLKNRPREEKDFIRSAVAAAQKGKNEHGA